MESTIQNIIRREVKDSLANHIKTVLFLREDYFNGTFNNSEFRIWKYSYWWTGAFYPVIIGKITTEKEIPKIQIRTKMNSFGKLIQWSILVGISYGSINSGIISFNLDSAHLLFSLGGLIFISLFLTPIRIAYWQARKDATKEFRELINEKI
jgi:hypothetical protein